MAGEPAKPTRSMVKSAAKAGVGAGATYSVNSVAATSSFPQLDAHNAKCAEAVARGPSPQAKALCQQALSAAIKIAPHTKFHATALSNHAALLDLQGRTMEAEAGHKQALAMYQAAMGPNHLSVATAYSMLGSFFYTHDRFAEAEEAFAQALAIDRRALGPEHPEVAKDMYNLANVLTLLGKHAEADAMYRRCLVIREKVLGSQDPAVARSLLGMGMSFAKQGRYKDASKAFKAALDINMKALGPNDPQTALSRQQYELSLRQLAASSVPFFLDYD